MSDGAFTPGLAAGAPASRRLPVRDVERSRAFYRDMLGFEERPPGADFGPGAAAELVRGAARIQLEPASPSSRQVVFLETEDVAGFRAVVLARGGQPSELARVNWIKYDVFEVRDPDGHALWFGQSFHQTGLRRPEGLLEDALPVLSCDDVAAAVRHYVDVLGFRINYQQEGLGVMYRDASTLLLLPRTAERPGPVDVEFYVRDADALHAELSGHGAHVRGEPVSHPWGLRDFVVLDLDGNRLTFAQPFE